MMHPHSPAVAAVQRFVDETLPDLLLVDRERRELADLLAGVSAAGVSTAYRNTLAPMGVNPADSPPDAPAAIRDLEGYGRLRHGLPPPLLLFVEELAHTVGGTTQADLYGWIDAVAARLDVDRGALLRARDAAGRRSPGGARRPDDNQAFLTIKVVHDKFRVNHRFFLTASFQRGEEPEMPLYESEESLALASVAEVVDDLTTAGPAANIEDLTLEFILPRQLIAHPVQDWTFDRHVFPRPLGIRYPVSVRSLERLENPSTHGTLRRKWRRLAEHGHRADPSAIFFFDEPGAYDPVALYSQLLDDDGVLCLAMPFPRPTRRTDGTD